MTSHAKCNCNCKCNVSKCLYYIFLWEMNCAGYFILDVHVSRPVACRFVEISLVPVQIKVFRSSSKINQNMQCSLKSTPPITMKFCKRHDSDAWKMMLLTSVLQSFEFTRNIDSRTGAWARFLCRSASGYPDVPGLHVRIECAYSVTE